MQYTRCMKSYGTKVIIHIYRYLIFIDIKNSLICKIIHVDNIILNEKKHMPIYQVQRKGRKFGNIKYSRQKSTEQTHERYKHL